MAPEQVILIDGGANDSGGGGPRLQLSKLKAIGQGSPSCAVGQQQRLATQPITDAAGEQNHARTEAHMIRALEGDVFTEPLCLQLVPDLEADRRTQRCNPVPVSRRPPIS
jgi:hypothetical protein